VEYPDTERFCPRDGSSLRAREQAADLVGSIVAERYHILQKIGAGGMGEVYLAEHVRLRRKSAVKVMHPLMANDPDALSRFNREATNACQIEHPNVAAIYDFGESSGGLVYLAMEYIDGASLTHIVARGALSLARTAELTRQIAAGLDAAHRLGIVHRDLKPDNILVRTDGDGRDRVKVVDFGISKAPTGEAQSVTHTGQVVGTLDYMSPEQMSGDVADPRSDVYSLGIVVFNMLTGQLPFARGTAMTSMLQRFRDGPARLEAMRPDLIWPNEVQAVLDGALALDVSARYATAPDFAAALTEVAGRVSVEPSRAIERDVRSTQSSAPIPAPVRAPVTTTLAPADVSAIETSLARCVGPIARVLVRRAAASAATRESLIAALAAEIEDERERAQFLAATRR
jgi:serine/threonine-protein kinase